MSSVACARLTMPSPGRLREPQLDAGRLLDPPDGAELARAVAVERAGAPVELLDEGAHLQRHPELPPEVDREPEVLGHKVEREALVVVAGEDAVDVALEEHRPCRPADERPAERPHLDARLRPQDEDLRSGLRVDEPQQVEAQFHRVSGAAGPAVDAPLRVPIASSTGRTRATS